MKNFLSLTKLIAVVIMSLPFVSCSDDDDSKNLLIGAWYEPNAPEGHKEYFIVETEYCYWSHYYPLQEGHGEKYIYEYDVEKSQIIAYEISSTTGQPKDKQHIWPIGKLTGNELWITLSSGTRQMIKVK